ncbi:hypothetical protein VH441_00790 [Psychrobacter sp. HD31]|uniref:hypothetical protein n=1 Tax=Psychrobacter sp. HD31 TaxID=3112003 RepID=UPI003DA6883A
MDKFKLTKKAVALSIVCAVAVVGCKKNEEQPVKKESAEVNNVEQAKAAEMAKPEVEPKSVVTTEQNANVNADTEVKTAEEQAAEEAAAKKKAAEQAAAKKKAAEKAAEKAAAEAAAKKKAAEKAAAKKKAAEQAAPKVKAGPKPKVVEPETNNLKAPTDDSVELEIVTSEDTY